MEGLTRTLKREVGGSNEQGKLLLTVQEAADMLEICGKLVYDLSHRKDFPTVKIGRRTLISKAGLAEWVRNQEQNRGDGL